MTFQPNINGTMPKIHGNHSPPTHQPNLERLDSWVMLTIRGSGAAVHFCRWMDFLSQKTHMAIEHPPLIADHLIKKRKETASNHHWKRGFSRQVWCLRTSAPPCLLWYSLRSPRRSGDKDGSELPGHFFVQHEPLGSCTLIFVGSMNLSCWGSIWCQPKINLVWWTRWFALKQWLVGYWNGLLFPHSNSQMIWHDQTIVLSLTGSGVIRSDVLNDVPWIFEWMC